MFFQVVAQSFTYGTVYGTADFAVTQFGLCLAFELRFGYLYRDNGHKTFAEVFALDFNLCLFDGLGIVFFGIFLQYTGQGSTETYYVCTAFDGIDVVYIRVEVFTIARVVHDGNFDRYTLLFCIQVNHIVDERCVAVLVVEETYEFLYTFFRMECFGAWIAFFVFVAKVCQ